jgi:hypothetical protein
MALKFVVRRGALRRFDRLKRATTQLPVDVIWDRRISTHPTEDAERAWKERRQQPSFTWTAADFAIVEDEEDS